MVSADYFYITENDNLNTAWLDEMLCPIILTIIGSYFNRMILYKYLNNDESRDNLQMLRRFETIQKQYIRVEKDVALLYSRCRVDHAIERNGCVKF